MKIQFLGAAQTVTGSCYMLEAGGVRFAVDCGLHQGNDAIEKRNAATEVYRAPDIAFVLLTHAHMDHSGLLPRIVHEGFKGPVYCTRPTLDLLGIMLADSAHIQEMEAEWATRKQKRKGAKPAPPLYTQADAAKAVKLLSGVDYDQSFEPSPGITVTYKNAGHILGSAFLELLLRDGDKTTRLVFSGDLGRPNALIIDDPERPDLQADYLFLESTYGDRDHKDETTSLDELAEAIAYSHSRGEKVIIPAFAVERTQEIIYCLYLLRKQGRLPQDMSVFVDSPLAIKATEIFRRHTDYYDQDLRELRARGEDPFSLPELRYTASTQESQAINAVSGPGVIISASGMCNAGRVKHHLRHNLWRPGASIVFVGYQGVGTPGRKIVDGARSLRILGEDTAVRAKIFTIGGFSAHAGQSQILQWVEGFARKNMTVVLVHGEARAQTTLAERLKERFSLHVVAPAYLEELSLAPGASAGAAPAPAVELVSMAEAAQVEPGVDWALLVDDLEAKITLLRKRMPSLSKRDWPTQAECRDKLLELNTELLRLVSHIQI